MILREKCFQRMKVLPVLTEILLLLCATSWVACGNSSMMLTEAELGKNTQRQSASLAPSFRGAIASLLKKRCISCHGVGKINPNDWQDF